MGSVNTMKYPLNLFVTGCSDCPFFNKEYCGATKQYVKNYWLSQTVPDSCPLIEYNNVQVWLTANER